MTRFVALSRLLAGAGRDSEVAFGSAGVRTRRDLARDVASLAGRIGAVGPGRWLLFTDDSYATAVGLPRNILHGLWTMAQVARAQTEAAGGDPRSLRRLSVQFRGMGVPEEEIVVSGTVTSRDGDRAIVATEAVQGGNGIVRNAESELELR